MTENQFFQHFVNAISTFNVSDISFYITLAFLWLKLLIFIHNVYIHIYIYIFLLWIISVQQTKLSISDSTGPCWLVQMDNLQSYSTYSLLLNKRLKYTPILLVMPQVEDEMFCNPPHKFCLHNVTPQSVLDCWAGVQYWYENNWNPIFHLDVKLSIVTLLNHDQISSAKSSQHLT